MLRTLRIAIRQHWPSSTGANTIQALLPGRLAAMKASLRLKKCDGKLWEARRLERRVSTVMCFITAGILRYHFSTFTMTAVTLRERFFGLVFTEKRQEGIGRR